MKRCKHCISKIYTLVCELDDRLEWVGQPCNIFDYWKCKIRKEGTNGKLK